MTGSPIPAVAGRSDTAAPAPRHPVALDRVAAGISLTALVVVAIVALGNSGISITSFFDSQDNAARFFHRVGALTFPDLPETVHLVGLTVGLVLTGTLLAAVLSVPVAYLAASNTTPGPGWRAVGRFISVMTRAVPDVVLAMVFALIFSLGTLPGICAIGIHSVGMISKLFADAIEQIDEGPRRAIRAVGGSTVQQFVSGILPQVLPSWVATVLHRNDINLRGSVVLGYVGVAGLGLAMSQSFQELAYGEGLGYAVIIFALCVVMEIVSSTVRSSMLGIVPTRRTMGDWVVRTVIRGRAAATTSTTTVPSRSAELATALRRPWTRERIRNTVWLWLAVVIAIGGVLVCDIQWGDILTVWAHIPETAAKFWPPSWGAYDAGIIFGAVGQTIAIALSATLLSLVLSLVIGSLAARNVAPSPVVRHTFRFVLLIIRGIPELILAILLIIISGLGPQAGIIALAFGGIGLLGKLIADSLEEVNPGPERALRATGASRWQVFSSATVPQGAPAMIGHSLYLLDTNLRAATILGIVGGGGVGYYLLNASQASVYQLVTSITLLTLVTVVVVEALAVWIRRVFR